jgi:hypothetical protein
MKSWRGMGNTVVYIVMIYEIGILCPKCGIKSQEVMGDSD